ncbi:zinc-finger associated domain (zf-AD) domain-containing protein [Phthorimaea operculella]|nr:zinc-finger associated domain (zf-AD) domain-containing protein [Phthorimaea operculella]
MKALTAEFRGRKPVVCAIKLTTFQKSTSVFREFTKMESRKKGLYTAKACRFCLSQDEPLSNLFEKKQAPKNSIPLSLKILSSIAVEVFPSEKMPPYICGRCSFFMDVVYDFKNICREADKSILDFVQTGSALEPIAWPPSLVKLFHYGSKKNPEVKNILKVEGGATVEVSQSMSDDDEDAEDENIYNVKIGDGSEEGASACVKVVTSKEPEKPAKDKKRTSSVCADSDDVDVDVPTTYVRSVRLTDGCYACDQCECTYPLAQLLELHKMQRHRSRDVTCDQCQEQFYTKYDLAIHMMRHTKETPFQCVACGTRFNRHILLKRHEKLVHSDLPQLKCHHCPASFLSTEEMDAHQVRHVNVLERKYTCTDCQKNPLLDMVHSDLPQLKCHHCPASFLSTEEMDAHQVRHVNVLERKYTCTDCQKNPLLDMVHSDLPQLKCHHCPASFLSTEEMDAHQSTVATIVHCYHNGPLLDMVHSDLPQLKCHHCPASFLSTEEMDAHQVRHVNVLERKYTCTDCQKK